MLNPSQLEQLRKKQRELASLVAKAKQITGDDYAAHKERARARQAAQSAQGRDIGELPPVENPERRAAAMADLQVFFETYFPQTFYLPWSPAHIESNRETQRAIENGETRVEAMPRGWGKSTRFERAAIWAALRGISQFCVIIGSDKRSAVEIIESIKNELENNDLLLADFPEVCYPIRKLERITQRARGQLYRGRPTHIQWTETCITLPMIEGSPAAGFIVRAAGLTARLRGMKHARPDGTIVRPDLVLLDDPQTDASARNPAQVAKRLHLVNGAVLRLAGPDKRITALASVTVIEPGDMADTMLDREQCPQWHGRRYKTVIKFPEDGRGKFDPEWWAAWERYQDVRKKGLQKDDGGKAAREHYKAHREILDAGVEIGWEAKIEPGDVSAIQSAMNWLLDTPESFWAEGQNDPKPPETGVATYDAEDLWAHVNKLPEGTVPADATLLTAFIDVQRAFLVWMVCAWKPGMAGHIVQYGTWPEQNDVYFQRRGAKQTLARAFPGKGASRAEQLFHGLTELTGSLLGKAWPVEREGGSTAELAIDLCLVDAGADTDIVVNWCRQQRNPRIMPSRGDGLKPSDTPIPERTAKDGQTLGHHWMIHVPAKRAIRHVFFDTNRWKSILADGLAAAPGAANYISFHAGTRARHRVLLDHLTAEYPEPTTQRGRTLDMWKLRVNRENDLFDCLVGAAVAASVRGIPTPGSVATVKRKRRRPSGSWSKQ